MTSVSDWSKWILWQLIGKEVNNILSEAQIRAEAGRHSDGNLDLALQWLIDKGIVMRLETSGEKRYVVNFDKLDVAQDIVNSRLDEELAVVQPFMPEPDGYVYWFDNAENERRFKRQNIYRFYLKKTDKMTFSAQLATKSMSSAKTFHMGSLNDSNSYISKLWTATILVAGESEDGSFILQNLQDKDRKACGNNRQRGKIALTIFRKLGYIQQIGTKGNSTRFKLTGKRPFAMTLDEIFEFVSE